MLKWTVNKRIPSLAPNPLQSTLAYRGVSFQSGLAHHRQSSEGPASRKRPRSRSRAEHESDKENCFSSIPPKRLHLDQDDISSNRYAKRLRSVENIADHHSPRFSEKRQKKAPVVEKRMISGSRRRNFRLYAPTLPGFESEDSPRVIRGLLGNMEEEVGFERRREADGDVLVNSPAPAVVRSQPGPQVATSSLVNQLVNLRVNKSGREQDDRSSFINELSLDQIVTAILSPNQREARNNCRLHEPQRCVFSSSSDSGFCSCEATIGQPQAQTGTTNCDRTIINLNEQFDERCVDGQGSKLSLRRQKNIRRKTRKASPKASDSPSPLIEVTNQLMLQDDSSRSFSPSLSEIVDTTSPSSRWERFNLSETYVIGDDSSKSVSSRTRRCLSFESPEMKLNPGRSSTPIPEVGSMEAMESSMETAAQKGGYFPQTDMAAYLTFNFR